MILASIFWLGLDNNCIAVLLLLLLTLTKRSLWHTGLETKSFYNAFYSIQHRFPSLAAPIPADDHRPNLRFELQQRREAPRSATKGHGRGGRGRQGGQGQGTTHSQAEQHNSRMRRQFPLRIGNSASVSLSSPLSSPFLSFRSSPQRASRRPRGP